jgi:hypothetical protein
MPNYFCSVCQYGQARNCYKNNKIVSNTNISSLESFFIKKFKLEDRICEVEYNIWVHRDMSRMEQCEKLPDVSLYKELIFDVRIFKAYESCQVKIIMQKLIFL